MKSIVLPGVLAGLVAWVWSALSWAVAGLHDGAFHAFPEASEPAAQALVESLDRAQPGEDRVYTLPAQVHPDGRPLEGEDLEAVDEAYRGGPGISVLLYRHEGRDPLPPSHFVVGLLSLMVAGGVAACLLKTAAPGIPGYWGRVGFVAGLGFFVVFAFLVQDFLWWGWPPAWGLTNMLDMVVSWLLAGCVLAKMIPGGERA